MMEIKPNTYFITDIEGETIMCKRNISSTSNSYNTQNDNTIPHISAKTQINGSFTLHTNIAFSEFQPPNFIPIPISIPIPIPIPISIFNIPFLLLYRQKSTKNTPTIRVNTLYLLN